MNKIDKYSTGEVHHKGYIIKYKPWRSPNGGGHQIMFSTTYKGKAYSEPYWNNDGERREEFIDDIERGRLWTI